MAGPGPTGDGFTGSLLGAGETILQSLPASFAMAGAGPSVELGAGALQAARGEMGWVRVRAINDAAKKSGTIRAAPGVVAEIIERETAESGEKVSALYIDPGAVVRLFQSQNADPEAAAEELFGPGGAERMREALEKGGGEKVEIPIATYLERIAGKPVADALAEHTTTRPYYQTASEEREVGDVRQMSQKLAEDYLANNVEPSSEAEKRLVDSVQSMLQKTGTLSAEDAKTSVATLRAFLRTQAQRFGIEPDVLFQDYLLRVRRFDEERADVQQEEAVDDSFDFGTNVEDVIPEAEETRRTIGPIETYPDPVPEYEAEAEAEPDAPPAIETSLAGGPRGD